MEVEEVVDTEARITARIIVLLDVSLTVHEEAGGIVGSAHPLIVQGAVLGALNIVGAVVLVLRDMQGTEIIAPLVSTVLLAPEVEEMPMMTGKSALVLFCDMNSRVQYKVSTNCLLYLAFISHYLTAFEPHVLT